VVQAILTQLSIGKKVDAAQGVLILSFSSG